MYCGIGGCGGAIGGGAGPVAGADVEGASE